MASASAAAPLQLDSRAWEHCVITLHHELGRIASREDCQDGVQEALMEAHEKPGLSVENLGAWVLVIARRRILDKHRAAVGRHQDERQRRRFVPAEALELAEQRISENEIVDLLQDGAAHDAAVAMARLSEEHQRLLTLSIEHTRYPDVAEILGISPKAAKARTLRAWDALRQAFIETERGPECRTIRGLMVRPRRRGGAGEVERRTMIAHLDSCAPCRAYEKRLKGLIATSPAPTLPFWQQLAMRLEQLLAGAPGPRSLETAAANALTSANAGSSIARMLAALCAGATAAGMCAAIATAPNPPPPKPRAQTPRAKPTVAFARTTPTATPTPTASPTRSTARDKRNRARRDRDPITGDIRQDTRSATASRPAAAPAGSTSTSEFTPSGGGSNAAAPPAPAPAAGGGEFRP